jgi:hypothetical protein
MMNEDIFTIQTYAQPFDNLVDSHYLLPFGDVHEGNAGCHLEMWQEWCDWAKEKPRSMFIGMGDYMEWFSDSERLGIRSINLHQSSQRTMDDFAKDMCQKFYERIKFMKGRLIGMMEGNHHYNFENGMTSTQYLCQLLECKYLGASAFTRITFSYNKPMKSRWTASIDVFSHHGKGASRLVGGSLNTVQQMAECADANIYLMGHDHKKSVGMSSKLCLTSGSGGVRLREKKLLYARTGSFLKGYEVDKPSYVTKKLLNPTDLGTVKIELTPKQKRKVRDGNLIDSQLTIDIHASI